MNTALTIAGSDSCGGAGIQADLKTMTTNGVYGMSAITALTAQNTTGVSDIYEVTADFLKAQLKAIFEDITPDAIKIGMVSSKDLIIAIAESLKKYNGKNIVLDPVMVATSGAKLISDDAIETLKEYLIPMATVITPNIPEAEVLSEMKITNEEEMIKAAEKSAKSIMLQFCAKVVTALMMPMIYCTEMVNTNGLRGNESTIQIHMEQDVHFQVLLLQILPREEILMRQLRKQKHIFQVL